MEGELAQRTSRKLELGQWSAVRGHGTTTGQRIAMILLATNPASPATNMRMVMRSAL